MERYRVNFPLLIGLVVGGLVVIGGVTGLYFYQANRNADNLLQQADQAKEKGELRDARGYLLQYVRLREEDQDAAVRLANLIADISQLPDAEPSERGAGVQYLEMVVREQPQETELRERLVEMLVQGGAAPRALDHINHLLISDPKNGELHAQRLRALYQTGKNAHAEKIGFELIGYDSAEDAFNAEKAATPGKVEIYQILAGQIRNNRGDPRLADKIMDQLVEVNPESSEAHLARGQYLLGNKEEEAAARDIEKALELDPKNVNALLAKAQFVLVQASEKNSGGANNADEEAMQAAFDQSYELLQQAAKADSGDWRVYRLLARLTRQQGDMEGSLAHYDAGIEAVDELAAMQLAFDKALAQLDANDQSGAQDTLKRTKEMGIPQMYLDYLNARLAELEGNWVKASDEYNRLRPTLSRRPELLVDLNVHLGNSYEQLGQSELALEAYKSVLQTEPSHRFAMLKVQQLEKMMGQVDSSIGQASVNDLVTEELRKPADQQSWDEVMRAAEEYAESISLDEGMIELVKAEIYVRRGMYEEAQKRVKKAVNLSGDNVNVWRTALRIVASDPEQGPAQAFEKMEVLTKKFGDKPILRLDKADFLIAMGDKELGEQLRALGENTDEFNKKEKIQLWEGLATRYGQIRDQESREELLNRIVELSPNELPTLLSLFRTAVNQYDKERIKELQAKIAKLVGSKDRATYLFTEASRLLAEAQRGATDNDQLSKAERLIERALLQREDWHELHLLLARVHLAKGDRTAALASFDQALEKGPADGLALLQHVALLLERGRYMDASRVLQKIDPPVRQRLFGRNYAEILLNTGAISEAIASADQVIEKSFEDGAAQLWYGRFCLQALNSPKLDSSQKAELQLKADAALAKAVELTPENGEVWLSRIGFLIAARQGAKAEQAIREAQLALTEDQLPVVMAKSYEALGRWFDAEQVYLRLLENRPDDLAIIRSAAEFYTGNRYPRPDKREKATPLLNKILKLAADDPDLDGNPYVLWARRKAAGILAATGDYQKLLDAEKLLASNVVNGALAEEDKLLLARILATRPEPVSRRKAIRLFTEVQRNRILAPEDDLRLGQLYYLTENWDAARKQMLETIARNPSVAAVRQRYIGMLLARGGQADLNEAQRQLARLQSSGASDEATLRLVVKVATKLGKEREARAAMRSLIPKNISSANPQALLMVAGMLTDLGDLDNAEKLFRAVAAKEPKAKVFLADFLGAHRDVEQSFALLDQIAEDSLSTAVRGGLTIVRARRDDVEGEFDSRIEAWLDKALREDPESIPYWMQRAEFRDLQQNYEEAADIYRKLLARRDLQGTQRAVVLNNLGYLLALNADSPQQAEEALGYVAEAVDILGPQADILDTRAVAHTALKQYDAATSDLELSLTDNPTASKYFHKARAHMLAGEMSKAVEAWKNAIALGLTRDEVATAEQEQFDDLQDKMERATRSAAG